MTSRHEMCSWFMGMSSTHLFNVAIADLYQALAPSINRRGQPLPGCRPLRLRPLEPATRYAFAYLLYAQKRADPLRAAPLISRL